MKTIIEKISVVVCEISYALAVTVAILLIPFALLLRAGMEIRAAIHNGQINHHYAKPYRVGLRA
jgi:hypothetical protein